MTGVLITFVAQLAATLGDAALRKHGEDFDKKISELINKGGEIYHQLIVDGVEDRERFLDVLEELMKIAQARRRAEREAREKLEP